jgi:predicted Na+-dependent transporter
VLSGLAWVGARARWVLAVGVVLVTFLPSLSAFFRPYLPGFLVLMLCVSMARLDLGALAHRATRPRRLAKVMLWVVAMMVVSPLVVWAGAVAVGMPEAQVVALVYTFAAPPISSSPAICLLLGLEAGFALELTVLSSLAAPFIGPMVTKLLLGEAVPLDTLELTMRVAAMMAAGVVAAVALRWLVGPDRIARNASALDGVATLVLLAFVIPLLDGFWVVTLSMPWFALGTFLLVLAANWGVQVVMVLAGRRAAGPDLVGAASLMWGNRNVSLYLAALPPDPLFGLYVAFYQLPMLFTPLVLGRILRGVRAARA